MSRLPIIPTVLVAGAVAVMVALGFWQLGRAEEKNALIARAEQALRMSAEAPYPDSGADIAGVLYRRTRVTCAEVTGWNATAGTSARGAKGWAHRIDCLSPAGRSLTVDIGWSRNPEKPEWSGGEVRGTIAPGGRIIAAEGLASLEPLAAPDPKDLPNNHIAYAGQWFFFALTALVIYWLALRRRRKQTSPE